VWPAKELVHDEYGGAAVDGAAAPDRPACGDRVGYVNADAAVSCQFVSIMAR
jgi:hypothetical protein